MNAVRSGTLAYWASGGCVQSHGGELTSRASLDLLRFLGRRAALCQREHDTSGARYCASVALELARAILAAEDWRRAGGLETRDAVSITALRTFTRDLKHRHYG